MLAREAFREMLFPLSEKELHYREHPEDSRPNKLALNITTLLI